MKITIAIKNIRRARDCTVTTNGVRIGDVCIRFHALEKLIVKRRFLIGPRVAILVTRNTDYRIQASSATIDNFLETLNEAWADYQETKWRDKSV